MSLFDSLKDTTSGYASALNAGSSGAKYTREEIEKQFEQRQKFSLYNLLDHAEVDLMIAGSTFKFEADRVKEYSPKVSETLYAWAKLFEAAIREKKDRDSEDWAEKTAKEINETL